MQNIVKDQLDIIYRPHPILPAADCQYRAQQWKQGQTVREILIANGIDQHQPISIIVDDRLLTVEEWNSVCPIPGQIINVKSEVEGGGGGGGGSNTWQVVAMIAIIVIAVVTWQYELIPAFAGMTAAEASAAGAMLIMAGGSMIVNAVFAAQIPSTSLDNMSGTSSATSPTYSISGGQNKQRQYESMPVVMGQHRMFFDMGSKPFTEYHGEDQYLYQVFHRGLSVVDFSDYQIGNNDINNYSDWSWKYADQNGKISAFPGNVDSSPGATLEASASWITRTTSVNSYRIGLDIEGTLYYANNSGGMDSTSVQLRVQYRAVGSSTWLNPSVINISGTGFISGSYQSYTNHVDQGYWEYDGDGNPTSWIDTSYDETLTRYVTGAGNVVIITGNSQSPRRATLFIDVPTGQYEVRIIRDTADSTDSRLANKTNWSTIRSYQTDSGNYYGQDRIGLTIRASEQLNGVVQQLSAYGSAKASYWNGSAFVFAETSNPAHWFMDFAIGRKNSQGKLMYGIGLSQSQIDFDALHSWSQFCATEGLTFNAVLDGSQSSADILSAIAKCGFASPTWASGKIGVVWDVRNATPVAAFGMSNIIKGSFTVSYITENLAEEIIVKYVNPDKDWQQDEVRVNVPGIDNPQRSSTIDILGCTSQTMAGKFANYLAAQQYYRRRRITWDCDFEGFVCNRGDVVLLSHDLTQWGYSGRVVSFVGRDLELDRNVPVNSSTNYLMLKRPDGTMTTYGVQETPGNTSHITLTSNPDFQEGYEPMDHIWFFSPLATTGKKVKILSVQPVSESRVQIVATDEYQEFYDAWDGAFVTPASSTLLQNPQIPVIDNLRIAERLAIVASGDIVTRVTISWDQLPSQVEKVNIRYRINDGEWRSTTAWGVSNVEVDFDTTGTVYAEATPVNGVITGEGLFYSQIIYGKLLPPTDVTGFTANIDKDIGLRLSWNSNPDIDIDSYEIRQGSTWASSILYGNTKANVLKIGFLPEGSQTWLIKAIDTSGNYSTNATSVVSTVVLPVAPTITGSFAGHNAVLNWSAVEGSLSTQFYEIRYGSSWAAGTLVGTAKATTFSIKAQWSGNRTFWIAAVDLNGNYGSAGSYDSYVIPPIAPSVTQEVVDNNVLLRWTDSKQTLPIDYYEIRKGATYATSDLIGNIFSEFTVIFETSSGDYKYWVSGVDVGGNIGTASSISATVNQPPDYQLQYNYNTDFSGTKSNMILQGGKLYGPFDTTETWQTHFTGQSWDQPQDQIDVGYDYYLEPTGTTGYYEETIDYGAILAATKITLTPTINQIDGTLNVTPKISVRASTSDPWTDYDDTYSIYVSNFRYVKFRLTFNGAGGDDLSEIASINLRFDVKLKNDAGIAYANSSDSGGTTVNFGVSFVDVHSITLTPQGTAARYAVYDFVDVPYPTSFKVLLFDNAGNRVSGNVSWNVKGV